MHAARTLRLERSGSAEPSDDSDDTTTTTTTSPGGGSSAVAARRAVWNQHPAVRQGEWEEASPLDLVAQLRGDYEQYTQEVYGMAMEEPAATIEDFRARRRRERLQLDSLHARLHGLRLILAMARKLRARQSFLTRHDLTDLLPSLSCRSCLLSPPPLPPLDDSWMIGLINIMYMHA